MKKLKILVACEESQAVTSELLKLGHEAYSCDILPCGGKYPEHHIQGDVTPLLLQKWDLIIAFPPCTHLSNSGARHFEKKRADGRQKIAIEFFMQFINANCDRIAVENPVNIIGGEYIKKHFPELIEKYNFTKSNQRIQPYQFGDEAQKTTCLWLKGLPELIHTKIVSKGEFYISPSGKKLPKWYNHNTNNKKDRQKSRSVTFQGIAKAMALQWTEYITNLDSEKYEKIEQLNLFQ